jgi:hypothetical protein
MESITQFITQELKLKVNEAKSAVARPQERKFLGFSFTPGPEFKRVIAPKALDRFKRRIREITGRAKGVSLKTTMEELATHMRGWRSYFGLCETPEVLIIPRHLIGWRVSIRSTPIHNVPGGDGGPCKSGPIGPSLNSAVFIEDYCTVSMMPLVGVVELPAVATIA